MFLPTRRAAAIARWIAALALLATAPALGADITLPGLDITLKSGAQPAEVATALKVVLGLTVISLAPAFLIALTSFTRIVIVLSMLRHAIGMPETPPNTVLVTLSLFLTLFTMMPVFERVNEEAYQPFAAGKIDTDTAFEKGMAPLREFMLRQTREADLALMVEVARRPAPQSPEEVSAVLLIPAFMLSELKSAFQIGFVIFLPALLIDLVASSVLMSMGMFMVPPVMISLPIKVLMFVLIDGWNIVLRSLVASFH
jgi:flagellar biosynthesis protein FliP